MIPLVLYFWSCWVCFCPLPQVAFVPTHHPIRTASAARKVDPRRGSFSFWSWGTCNFRGGGIILRGAGIDFRGAGVDDFRALSGSTFYDAFGPWFPRRGNQDPRLGSSQVLTWQGELSFRGGGVDFPAAGVASAARKLQLPHHIFPLSSIFSPFRCTYTCTWKHPSRP